MSLKFILSSILVVILTAALILNNSITYSQGEVKYMVIMYAPHISLNSILNRAEALNITVSTIQLKLDGPLNPDYYAYWLLLGKRPVENISLLEYKPSVKEEERLRLLWSNATLIDIPLVNLELNISAVNTMYNLTFNTLKPEILEVPVNNSIFWKQLNTTIRVELKDVELAITLEKYNVTLALGNITIYRDTTPRAINVTDLEGVANGLYYIVFYVLNVENNTIKLLFPGSLRTSGFTSGDIKPIEGLLVPWTLIYTYRDFYIKLPEDVREWIMNLTIETTQRILIRAIDDTNTSIYIIYAPHIVVARALNITSSVDERLSDAVFSVFKTFIQFRKPGFFLVFFNPVVNEESGFAAFYGGYTMSSDLEFTVSQFTSILLSYSQISPIPGLIILDNSAKLSDRVKELERQVSDLTSKVNELNTTLQDTNNRLASCESTRDLLEVRLIGINETLKRAEELERTAYLYISTGLLVTVAIGVLMGFFAIRSCRAIGLRHVREIKSRFL
jgi:hypothetical protein